VERYVRQDDGGWTLREVTCLVLIPSRFNEFATDRRDDPGCKYSVNTRRTISASEGTTSTVPCGSVTYPYNP